LGHPVTVAELSQEAQVSIKYEIPERCLLAQAAIYVARGDVPIPDEIYLASPAQSVGWSDQLIWALRAGRLHARGNLFRGLYFERNGSLRLLSLEIEDAAIRPEFWSRELIDLPISSMRADVDTVCSNCGVSGEFEFGLTQEEEDDDPDVCFVFSQITVATKNLFELFQTQHTPSKSPLIVNKNHVANVVASGSPLAIADGTKFEQQRLRRRRPTFEKVKKILETLYPSGVPDQIDLTNQDLYGAVVAKAKADNTDATFGIDTVLRAAGRRRS
jgi:hypothetical protein